MTKWVLAIYVLASCASIFWTISRGKGGVAAREPRQELNGLPIIPRRSKLILMSCFFCLPLLLLFCALVEIPRSDAAWLVALGITFGYFVQMGRVVRHHFDRAAASPKRLGGLSKQPLSSPNGNDES